MQEFDINAHIVLENNRVRLEPLTPGHLPVLAPIILKDTGLMKYSFPSVTDEAELQQYIERALQQKREGSRYPFIIYDKQSRSYAGCTSYAQISNQNGMLEIGYTWLGFDYQRTGLNRAMKYLMLSHAFETLGFSRVEFRADSRNMQSRTAMEQIGVTFEGELRSNVVKQKATEAALSYTAYLPANGHQLKPANLRQ